MEMDLAIIIVLGLLTNAIFTRMKLSRLLGNISGYILNIRRVGSVNEDNF